MDKTPVYPGAIPLDTNILQPQRNTEIALGFLMQAAFGTSTVVDGLAVSQTTVPSMAVQVGPGSIIVATTVDTLTSGFGSLPVDNADALVKIGINLTSTTLTTLTPPAVSGQSQNWLVEAQFLEADGTPVVLPYYNASNPAQPYLGPANSGSAQNTARTNRVQLQYKAGTAAATGTQNTPAPDSGWVGLAIVTVANGQASILNANITPYSYAPYVPTKLAAQRTRLMAPINLYVSPTGNDLNSGLSAASPFATLQRAWNVVVTNYDLNGFSVTVNVANGTYTQGLVAQGIIPGVGVGNTVLFLGNAATPSNVVISTSNAHAVLVANSAAVSLSGMQLQASGSYSGTAACALLATTGANVFVTGPMVFGACAGSHIWAASAAQISASNLAYTISGNAQAHYNASGGGITTLNVPTVTLTGTPAFSTAFADASYGLVQVTSATFTGAATGTRYSVTVNGAVNTSGGGASYFPGSAVGSVSSGGQYV